MDLDEVAPRKFGRASGASLAVLVTDPDDLIVVFHDLAILDITGAEARVDSIRHDAEVWAVRIRSILNGCEEARASLRGSRDPG